MIQTKVVGVIGGHKLVTLSLIFESILKVWGSTWVFLMETAFKLGVRKNEKFYVQIRSSVVGQSDS